MYILKHNSVEFEQDLSTQEATVGAAVLVHYAFGRM